MSHATSHPLWKKSLAVLGSSVVLVIGFDYVTYAATGSSLLLGKSNNAGATTTIGNSGLGPVLSLQVPTSKAATTAPIKTNAKGLVANFNSQYLGGKTAAQLLTASATTKALTYTDTTGTHGSSTTFIIGTGVPAGTYLVSLNAWVSTNTSGVLLNGTVLAASPVIQYMRCYLHDNGSGTVLAEASSEVLDGSDVAPSFAMVRAFTAGEDLRLDCYTATGDGWSSFMPVTLSFVKLDGNTARTM